MPRRRAISHHTSVRAEQRACRKSPCGPTSPTFSTPGRCRFASKAPPLGRARSFAVLHVNGQLVTGLSPWSRGGHVVIGTPQGYRYKAVLERFWAIVEHFRVNAFSGVPTVYAALLQTPIGSHDVSSVEFGYYGAA